MNQPNPAERESNAGRSNLETSSSSKPSLWNSIARTAAGASAGIGKTVSQAGKAVTDTVGQTGAAASQLGTMASATLASLGTPKELHPIDWTTVSEDELLAFYGALFAIAAADGSIAPEEADFISQSINISHLSDSAKLQLGKFQVAPPPPEDCLKTLSKSNANLRWTLLFYLIEIIWVDDILATGEQEALQFVRETFGVKAAQTQAIQSFVITMKKIAAGDVAEARIIEVTQQATAKLQATNVPVLAIYKAGKTQDFAETQEYYSEENFWKKIVKFALIAGREVIEKALILYYVLQKPDLPVKEKGIVMGALGYLILPLDIAPDFLPVVGFSDDIGALLVAIAVVASHITPAEQQAAKQKVNEIFGQKS